MMWDGNDVHDPTRSAGCWADRDGNECGDVPSMLGLCGEHYVLLGGERPVMPLPAPPSIPAQTGCGRR